MTFRLSNPFPFIIKRQQLDGNAHKGPQGTPNPPGPAKETLFWVQIARVFASSYLGAPTALPQGLPQRPDDCKPDNSPCSSAPPRTPAPSVPSLPPVPVNSRNTSPAQPSRAKKSHAGAPSNVRS